MKKKKKSNLRGKRQEFRGIGASPWIAIGKVQLLDSALPKIPKHWLSDREVSNEIQRFFKAVEQTQKQFVNIRDKLRKIRGSEQASIIDTYQMIAKDKNLVELASSIIGHERINAEWALEKTCSKLSPRLKGSITDLEHVSNRILKNLLGIQDRMDLSKLGKEVILVAHDLSPAETAQMVKGSIGGFVTALGGQTSHTSILARALEIPAVVGVESISGQNIAGASIIVDGPAGKIIVYPSPKDLKEYEILKKKQEAADQLLLKEASFPALTKDGVHIQLFANIDLSEEIQVAKLHGATGIGLFRTEILYLKQQRLPTETEQFETYKRVLEQMEPYPVIIRTLDIGGDKFVGQAEMVEGLNPALGLKSIRFCLHEKDIFRTQLRALLRASPYGHLRIMIPMVTTLEEIHQVKELLEEVKKELTQEKLPFSSDLKLGAMIEVPSAALIAHSLAAELEFLSIGSNDLIQYTLAIDRGNEHVAFMYDPLHPAVLSLIHKVLEAGDSKEIEVGICGEIAGDPKFLPILIGLGIRQLSMSPYAIPRVKKILRQITLTQMRELSDKVLRATSSQEITALLEQTTKGLKGLSPLTR